MFYSLRVKWLTYRTAKIYNSTRHAPSQLSLNGREKRGRLFVEKGSDASMTVKGLKQEVRVLCWFVDERRVLAMSEAS